MRRENGAAGLPQPLVRVLRNPAYGHLAFTATTERAGDVILHSVDASAGYGRPGLSVVSVAAAPDVASADVLAVAHDLAGSIHNGNEAQRRSPFDLPLGETPLWTVSEEKVLTQAWGGREERHRALLPCWSSRDDYDLRAAALGFPVATRILEPLLAMTGLELRAGQTTMARYSRYGFEAAAVTAYLSELSEPREGVARLAELRFGHPYAVVAVATDMRQDADGQWVRGPWHGIPVFSGWVSEPENVPEADPAM